MSKLKSVFGLIALASLLFADESFAASIKKIDGIVTQINLQEGTLLIRNRDGSPLVIKLPFEINTNLSAKGILDEIKGTLENVTEIKIKNATDTDALPILSRIYPGFGTVGTRINMVGTGFTKKNNNIFIDNIPYAAVGIPSKDGLNLYFGLPIAPCDQRVKKCSGNELSLGDHQLQIANDNGRSNTIPFTVTASAPLQLITEYTPQVVAKTLYEAKLSATGGARSYIWRIFEGNLPQGIRMVQPVCADLICRGDATLKGFPTIPGKYDFKISLTSGNENITKQFSIVVVQPINTPQY